ncbi:MAG: 16S rRNA (cytidine(1402)-2'-O)-methyltransferase [Acidobacteriota bacterium]|nr:16S rRNA (cytidine(1402)-2'-O)-methyltransferase [Acidobacteriota bacterium]
MPGTLFIVATPIGNLADLTERARETLGAVDLVACEDTRRSGRLLQSIGVRQKLVSLHEHNEARQLAGLVSALANGSDVAIISDAGTPLLSDPGFLVVRAAAEAGHRIEAIPGPSAILTALACSGLPPYPFTFLGFPPPKTGKRKTWLRRFAELDHTLVIFESPHRLLASLGDMVETLGDRPAAIGRELTKLHEETLRGLLSAVLEELEGRPSLKGEFVVVLGRAD